MVVPTPTVTDLSPLAVEVEGYACDVWGGDGDGFEAVWHQELTLLAANPRAENVSVEGVDWSIGEVLTETMAVERGSS